MLAFILRAEGQLKSATLRPVGMANTTIYADVPADMIAQLPGYPENARSNLMISDEWWTANAEAAQVRWLDWMSRT